MLTLGVKFIETYYKENLYIYYSSVIIYTLICLLITACSVKKVRKDHKMKLILKYKFDKNDFKFDSLSAIINLSLFCMIAAILSGISGIAGGMIIGPLFLSYNMLPQVMGATN